MFLDGFVMQIKIANVCFTYTIDKFEKVRVKCLKCYSVKYQFFILSTYF